ncbi:MAG: ATP-binding cassette domain-containing protein [Dethiobacteria bacterium]
METVGLTKYYGKARGIVDLNLRVEEGGIFGFVGPNGAGKSTTIRTLLNLTFPSSGHARIFGLDVARGCWRRRSWRTFVHPTSILQRAARQRSKNIYSL